ILLSGRGGRRADEIATVPGRKSITGPTGGRPRTFTRTAPRCLMGMKSHTEDGILVLADISGFTAFVAGTELEHGPPMVAELLGEVMTRLSPPLEIQEVEGDAVFALGA